MSTEYDGWTITVTTEADSIGGADGEPCDAAAMDAAWPGVLRAAFAADFPGAEIVINIERSTLTKYSAWHAGMDDLANVRLRFEGASIEGDAAETLGRAWADPDRWIAALDVGDEPAIGNLLPAHIGVITGPEFPQRDFDPD